VPGGGDPGLIQREIEAVNANFARVETHQEFFLIERQLTPEDRGIDADHEAERNLVKQALRD